MIIYQKINEQKQVINFFIFYKKYFEKYFNPS